MTLQHGYQNTITVDHRIPLGRGGINTRQNTVGACYKCNQLKGLMTEAEFREFPHLATEVGVTVSTIASHAKRKLDRSQIDLIIAGILYRRGIEGKAPEPVSITA